MIRAKRTVSNQKVQSDEGKLSKKSDKVKNNKKVNDNVGTKRVTRKTAKSTANNLEIAQKENRCDNEKSKKPKLPKAVYGDNSSFFDSLYHAINQQNEEKQREKRKIQRDRLKAVKNVQISTPINVRKRKKCDLHFNISPISMKNSSLEISKTINYEDPVHKQVLVASILKNSLTEDILKPVNRVPEKINDQSSHLVDNDEEPAMKVAKLTTELTEDILKPVNGVPEKINDHSSHLVDNDEEPAMKVAKLTTELTEDILKPVNGVPEKVNDHSSHLVDNDEEPAIKVAKLMTESDENESIKLSQKSKDENSLVVPEFQDNNSHVQENEVSIRKVVQFVDPPNENMNLFEDMKFHEKINLKPGKWRKSLAAWRKSNNTLRLSKQPSKKFIALFPIRTDPGIFEEFKKKLETCLEKSVLLEQSDDGRLQAELSLLDSSIDCASIQKSYVLQRKNSQRETSVFKKSSIFYGLSAPLIDVDILSSLSSRQVVLRRCGQQEPLLFDDIYSESQLTNCKKIGEGVYGEVFMYKPLDDDPVVLKIIPIEGDLIVNGGPQKRFSEILSEIVIAEELCGLSNGKENKTDGFVKIKRVKCVKGAYPQHLLDAWEIYNDSSLKGSENDNPDIFDEDQLYIVFEQYNAGLDLEAFIFKNAEEAFSIFVQVALTLAVAENQFEFEHRDLHWGNILITRTIQKYIKYHVDGKVYEIPSYGVKATIIDFTLSRMEYDGAVIYDNLAKDQELFESTGDYQFDIYRLMRYRLENDFKRYDPYTNLLWLHYLLDKLIDGARYKYSKSDKHKSAVNKMMQLRDTLLEENQSASDFVKSLKN